ncbi:uncharacterized protein LOC143291010 [Babylonia areolata]|uniref:uncharacterized protein LOC143291010 n=1 Tax=Babylonia areolata TaxID=304850 RepID=UPI003FD2440B
MAQVEQTGNRYTNFKTVWKERLQQNCVEYSDKQEIVLYPAVALLKKPAGWTKAPQKRRKKKKKMSRKKRRRRKKKRRKRRKKKRRKKKRRKKKKKRRRRTKKKKKKKRRRKKKKKKNCNAKIKIGQTTQCD